MNSAQTRVLNKRNYALKTGKHLLTPKIDYFHSHQ